MHFSITVRRRSVHPGVLHVERRRYAEALDTYTGMYDTAKQLGEPATLAHALMNIGVELDRADRKRKR